MNLFYTPDIETETYSFNEEESAHCVKVLRLRKDDIIFLTNGKGVLYKAKLTDDNKKCCTVQIVETTIDYKKKNYQLHVAIAPTKNIDRIEWFLEKATEIGIHEITPIITKHSERKNIQAERLNKIITAAMKQSLQAYRPILNQTCSFTDFMVKDYLCEKYICHYHSNNKYLKEVYTKNKNVLILIGPEGDFDENELIKAKEHQFQEVNIGDDRYRTETAALMTCHTIHLINQ